MSLEETLPQLRERIDAQNKELAGLRQQNTKLLSEAASARFELEGYNPKHAELYVRTAEDGAVPTVETIRTFAEEWDLGKRAPATTTDSVDEAAPVDEEEPNEDQGADLSHLDRLSRSGSASGDGSGGTGTEKMTRADWIKLSQKDRAAADSALRQGKVQLSGDEGPVPRGSNPYDSE